MIRLAHGGPRALAPLLSLAGFLLASCDTHSLDPDYDAVEITVRVAGAGNGFGRVVGTTGSGIDCEIGTFGPGTNGIEGCSNTFADAGLGGIIDLVATPDSGGTFAGFSGDCSGATCRLSFPPGMDRTFSVQARFLLPPPGVAIQSPANGTVFPASSSAGATVTLAAGAADGRGGPIAYNRIRWTSSIDGVLCPGGPGPTTCTLTLIRLLSIGTHVITVQVEDSEGTPASASVQITVGDPDNTPPIATITSPQSGAQLPDNQPVALVGAANDAEDGALSGAALSWSSDRDGALGTGATLSRTLSAGAHLITLTATDSDGAIGTATVNIQIVPPASGTGSITGRVTGNGFGVGGATMILSGTASATTTTDASGYYTFSNLPPGSYTIRVNTELNITFQPNPQTVTLGAGQQLTVNFPGTY